MSRTYALIPVSKGEFHCELVNEQTAWSSFIGSLPEEGAEIHLAPEQYERVRNLLYDAGRSADKMIRVEQVRRGDRSRIRVLEVGQKNLLRVSPLETLRENSEESVG